MPSRSLLGIGAFAALFVSGELHAQVTSDGKVQVSVPLVGCKSDGQAGPVEAPENGTISVTISRAAGQNLAYYKASSGIGVLALRGWHCFCIYGSSGETLFVSPEMIDT